MKSHVSTHAHERVRGRLGLPAKAVERTVQNALIRGQKRTQFTGSLRRYLDLLWHRGIERAAATDIIVYGDIVYLFKGATLVTTWPLPSKYHKIIHKRKGNGAQCKQQDEDEDEVLLS